MAPNGPQEPAPTLAKPKPLRVVRVPARASTCGERRDEASHGELNRSRWTEPGPHLFCLSRARVANRAAPKIKSAHSVHLESPWFPSTIRAVKQARSSWCALGTVKPPDTVRAASDEYRFVRFFKHDFFAATALYQGQKGKVVVKFGRQAPIFGLPAQWIGRVLAWHESRAYAALADVEAVPEFLGRVGPTAIVHEFIEGEPLARGRWVPDDFFELLRAAIDTLHQRGMAYVDLEKRQNVLVGTDGKPYLIDFQICWDFPRQWGGELFPARWLRHRLQDGDLYHLTKLQRRIRPDQLTAAQIKASYRKPLYVRVHRWLTVPFLKIRRALLNRIDPPRSDSERGAVIR